MAVRYKGTPQVVIKAGEDAAKRIGKKFGAFVYTSARGSIRKRKSEAPPGSPPRDKSGTLKKNIVFAYEDETRLVVIGARPLPNKTPKASEVLELGGNAPRRVFIGGKRARRNVNYKARPFMRPALQKNLPKLPALWANAIRL